MIEDGPSRIVLSVAMQTAGMIVLSDLWDVGWHAYLHGEEIPILRANHALRGVVVSAGQSVVEFRYEPASFAWGLGLAGFAAIALLIWAAVALRGLRQRHGDGHGLVDAKEQEVVA